MSEREPSPESLRAEYGVVASYITAMTGMRFQTLAIYLAAVGLVSRENASSLTGLLILVVSVGLWVLDLRNRDVLHRLGERGEAIEEIWGNRLALSREDPRWPPKEGGAGFFLDVVVPPRIRFLTLDSTPIPGPLPRWWLTHAFGIDVVFLGVIGYAIALVADAREWPSLLVALGPLVAGLAVVSAVRLRGRRGR
jgi:hypothetical protein